MSISVHEVYCDGGVVRSNPSPIGGTWAYCFITESGSRILSKSGSFTPASIGCESVTNNQSEQMAMIMAMEALPVGWCGIIYSDSAIAIGRAFQDWKTKGLPESIVARLRAAVCRLGEVEPVLLQGHPTKLDLEYGVGKKRKLPVSIHNVWCDKQCGTEAALLIESGFES